MNKNEKQQDVAEKITAVATNKPEKQTLLWLAIIILLGLLVGLFWFVQQQYAQTHTALQSIDHTEQLNHDLVQLKKSFTGELTTTNDRLTLLETVNTDFSNKINNLVNSNPLTNGDVLRTWRIAKITFLLHAANQQILLAGNIKNAQTALMLADKELKELTDPRLFQLRTLIANEQLALASVAKVDIEGISIALQSALDNVDSLTLLIGPELVTDSDLETRSSPAESWQSTVAHAWNEIKSLLVIRHQQEGVAAVLVPEQRYFLYQNLRLKLESAQLALLSGSAPVFKANLMSIEQWLQHYFVGADRDAMMILVTALQSEQISVDLPDLSASLVWIQQQGGQ